MNDQIKYLLKYQSVDGKVKEIEDSLKKTEEAKKYYTASKFLKTVGEVASSIDAKAKPLIDSYNALVSDVKQLENQAEEFAKSVESCENDDELNYLKKKFQDVANSILQKEDAIKNLQKNIDDIFNEYNKLKEENGVMKAQYNEFAPKFKELRDSKAPEVKSLKSELEEIAKNIEPSLMQKYISKREDKRFPIIFGVDTSTNSCYCPACATGMSISAKNELVSGNIKECENCRRLLYSQTELK
ncbi:MAG: hypothetical protein IKV61_05110 [Clostridia bacterium]|nr:hypothetical protein [Clostridia bacterium]